MNPGEMLSGMPAVQALGWALLHFLWQGAVIAALVGVLLALMRRFDAGSRYVVCCAGMLLMVVTPIATFFVMLQHAAHAPAALPAGLAGLIPPESSLADRLSAALPFICLAWMMTS